MASYDMPGIKQTVYNYRGVTQERGVLSVGHNQQTFLLSLQKADKHEYLYHE